MRLVVASCTALLAGASTHVFAEPLSWSVRGELGAEYDTNPARLETVEGTSRTDVPASPAGRAVAAGDLAWRFGEGHLLVVSGSGAGRWFSQPEARDEDVGVAQGSTTLRLRFGKTSATALAGYYDAFQRGAIDPRDFRSIASGLRLDRSFGQASALGLSASYRWFTYKPERAFDFQAPAVQLAYRQLFPGADLDAADWDLQVLGGVEARLFEGQRCTSAASCPTRGAGRRRDLFWAASVEVTRTADALFGAGLAFHRNQSNSFGDTLSRGVLHLRAVLLLPWSLSLSGRGELVFTSYRDPVPLLRNNVTGAPLVSIEDENRSMVRLELQRLVTTGIDAGLRYTLFTNELRSEPARFRRQTVLAFLSFALERP